MASITSREEILSSSLAFNPTDLVAEIRQGDPRAEAELVTRCGRAVRVVLRQLLRGRAEAEDFFQETFRLVIEKVRRGDLRDPATLPRFAVSVARNLAIDHFRIETRRRTEPDSEVVAEVSQTAPDQLGRLLVEEKATLVRRVIEELGTDRDRQVLYRFYIAEEDKATICHDLGLDSLHFNRVLHRARQRYRQLYEKAIGS